MPTKAARYHVVAGERSARRWGYKEAAEHLERARVLLEGMPESRDRDVLELRVSLNHGWSVCSLSRCGAGLGRAEPALEVIASTLTTIERTDGPWLEPELHRLRGEVLKACNDAAEAERSIATAIEIARRQGSRSLQLRATLSLHALASGAKRKRARQDIAGLLSVVTEGHDTPDLLDARAVVAS